MTDQLVAHGTLLHYEARNGDGTEPLIFLHGWRSRGSVWNGVAEKLATDQRSAYLLDLPGFGASPTPRQTYTLDDYADVIADFLKQKKITRATLIGHSFGGRIAIKLAARNPEHLSRLVLVDSAGFAKKTSRRMRLLTKITRPLFRAAFMQPLRARLYHALGADDYLATPALQATFVRIVQEDLTALLPRIAAPTLIVWGEKDVDTPISFARRLQNGIPQAHLKILSHAGHFSFQDQPAEFVSAITAFLDAHPLV